MDIMSSMHAMGHMNIMNSTTIATHDVLGYYFDFDLLNHIYIALYTNIPML